jgi:hypothetical protein
MHRYRCEIGNVASDARWHNLCGGMTWAWFSRTGTGGVVERGDLHVFAPRINLRGRYFKGELHCPMDRSMRRHAWQCHGLRIRYYDDDYGLFPCNVYGVYESTNADLVHHHEMLRLEATWGPDREFRTPSPSPTSSVSYEGDSDDEDCD